MWTALSVLWFLLLSSKLCFSFTYTSKSLCPTHSHHHGKLQAVVNGDDGAKSDTTSIPQHVAFVCDGNSRWAAARNLPAVAGHVAGTKRVVELLDALRECGVMCCTMFAFSTENWNRPRREVNEVLNVMEQTARQLYRWLLQEKFRIRILGDLTDDRIPESLRSVLRRLQDDTQEATKNHKEPFTLCIAVNYGGRQDIVSASKRLVLLIAEGAMDVEDVSEHVFSSLLGTEGMPDPDLIIRTSGESRLSNFLLWNAAYSELYFADTLWPDFDRDSLRKALTWYASRRRRFGARTISEETVRELHE